MGISHKRMGILYVVSTPIGNLEDITLRALRILGEVSLIAAEDTRHTQRLLKRYDIMTRCLSYHEHNKLTRLDAVLAALDSGDVALVSDAGTPAISDPGLELVQACIAAGYAVVPIPGPGAPIAALAVAGLPTDRFLYVGFLPRRRVERRALLTELSHLAVTLVCFEAPHRLVETLADALDVLGDRKITVAKDLTKLHERLLRTRIGAALAHFRDQPPRGEYTLVIEGRVSATARIVVQDRAEPTEEAVIERLRILHAQGQGGSMAARTVAHETGWQKSVIYQLWLQVFGAERKDD